MSVLELPKGIPSHDTFGRVFGMLETEELEKSFLSWISSLTEKMDIELIQIDGKTKRGSYDREKGLNALHSISAWSSERGLMLAQKKVDSKSTYILQQNKRTTGGKGQESGKRSRSEKTAKQWKPFLCKPRP